MHTTGLALDIMTISNWDVYVPSRIRANQVPDASEPAAENCRDIVNELNNNDELQSVTQRYHFPNLQPNIRQRLEDCIAGNLPWTTIPPEVITIFESHGFYWGGNGWDSRPPIDRSDSMHFEYTGLCR